MHASDLIELTGLVQFGPGEGLHGLQLAHTRLAVRPVGHGSSAASASSATRSNASSPPAVTAEMAARSQPPENAPIRRNEACSSELSRS
jgi:hypothetical protein